MNRNRQPRRQPTEPANSSDDLDPLSVVEHITTVTFARRCPHRFHLNDFFRFGDQVGRCADAVHASYRTIIDPEYGELRVFPITILQKVYRTMAKQFGWEPLEAERLPEHGGQSLRGLDTARRRVEEVAADVTDPVVAQAFQVVTHFMENDLRRMRGEPPVAGPSTPLRPV